MCVNTDFNPLVSLSGVPEQDKMSWLSGWKTASRRLSCQSVTAGLTVLQVTGRQPGGGGGGGALPFFKLVLAAMVTLVS